MWSRPLADGLVDRFADDDGGASAALPGDEVARGLDEDGGKPEGESGVVGEARDGDHVGDGVDRGDDVDEAEGEQSERPEGHTLVLPAQDRLEHPGNGANTLPEPGGLGLQRLAVDLPSLPG